MGQGYGVKELRDGFRIRSEGRLSAEARGEGCLRMCVNECWS